MNTLEGGIWVSLLLLRRGLLFAHTAYHHSALSVFLRSVPRLVARITTIYGVYQTSYQALTKKSFCIQMKIEE